MSAESILKISVEDAPFQLFKALWDSYDEALKKQPEIWKQVAGSHRALSNQWAKVATQFSDTLGTLEKTNEQLGDQEKHLTFGSRLWSGMEKSSSGVAKNILGATTAMLKWTGLMTGITGLLGYFSFAGLERLGANASGWRQNAMGLGLSIGQERAFNIAFGQTLGNPSGFLSGINTMATNIAAQAPLYMLGVNPSDTTSNIAVNTLKRLRTLAQSTPTNQLGIMEQMYQLQNMGIGVEDLRRLQSIGQPEFNRLLGTYAQGSRSLNIGDKTAQAWQSFIRSMDTAKGRIESVFVTGLVNLSGPISGLTNSFADLLSRVMKKDGPLSHGIDEIAKWINDFSGKISKPEFLTKIDRFTKDLGTLADAIHGIAHPAETTSKHPLAVTGGAVGGALGYAVAGKLGAAGGIAAGGLLGSKTDAALDWLSLHMRPLVSPALSTALGKYGNLEAAEDSLLLPAGVFDKIYAAHPTDFAAYLPTTPAFTGAGIESGIQSLNAPYGGNPQGQAQLVSVLGKLADALQALIGSGVATGKPAKIEVTNKTGANLNASVAQQGAQ